jgi:site-specific recombinase XerD
MADSGVYDRWTKRVDGRRVPSESHGQGKRWQARWRDETGRQRKRNYDRKVDAERFPSGVKADVVRGHYVDPAAVRVTVAEYARHWAASRPHRATTATKVAGTIERHLALTRLGSMPIAAVRKSDVQSWATDRARLLAPSTTRVVLTIVGAVFKAAVEDRVLAFSPARGISLPKHERPRVLPLTVAQVRQLAEAAAPRCRAMVIAQAGLGLRIGELLALRIEDVDFLRRTVRVEHQIQHNSRERVEPKTPRSRRQEGRNHLRVHRCAQLSGKRPRADRAVLMVTRWASAADSTSCRAAVFNTAMPTVAPAPPVSPPRPRGGSAPDIA